MVIHVSDLKVGKKVEIIEDMEAAVLTTVAFEEEKEDVPAAAVVSPEAAPAA